jgi:purine-binding chemotaxis protein CheW
MNEMPQENIKQQNEILAAEQDALNTENQYLTFILADEIYGIDILKIQEIRGWTGVTQIPNAPEYIRGVMNLRGAIVPILDLRRRFNMDELEFTQQTVVIVVHVQERTIGMVVDSVSDVKNLPNKELRATPDFGTSIDASFIHGLIPDNDRMNIILNIDELLAGCDLLQLDKITEMSAEKSEGE